MEDRDRDNWPPPPPGPAEDPFAPGRPPPEIPSDERFQERGPHGPGTGEDD